MPLRNCLAAVFVLLTTAGGALAREEIRIVGSSTVYPFATAVADHFGNTGVYRTPVIESTGTGGGFKLFCAGVGVNHPDITNASRPIKPSEERACRENGVTPIQEVRIGFDGIVLGQGRRAPRFDLTLRQIFLALAKTIPGENGFIPNPHRRWNEVDPGLPDMPIRVLGPPPTSGTRDAFVELAMEGGCRTFPELAALKKTDKARYKSLCHAIREDGAYVEAGENDNLIVQKLDTDPTALGIFGFSFLAENRDLLRGARVDGVPPTFENIAAGRYPISRSLFFYVKLPHVGLIPGIREYVDAFTRESAMGPNGYLSARGLIPLPDAERAEVRRTVLAALDEAARKTGTVSKDGRTLEPIAPGERPLLLFVALLVTLTVVAYRLGRRRAVASVDGQLARLHSRPNYHGHYVALWCGLPAFTVFLLWMAVEPAAISRLIIAGLPADLVELGPERLGLLLNDIRNTASGNVAIAASDPVVRAAAVRYGELREIGFVAMSAVVLATALGGFLWARRRIAPDFRARIQVEKVMRAMLFLGSTIAVFSTVGIILSLLFEAIRFFNLVSLGEFLFGLQWSPQTALRADQVGSSGAFGAVPVFTGTFLITALAMFIAGPVGLMSAIYMSEYASRRVRAAVKPALEILAGIPTVVFGFFAALTVAPAIRDAGAAIGLDVASESALAAGVVMGIMIIPFVSSLSDDVINAVPQSLRDGSYALGATKSETIKRVVVPAALPGIVGALLLAVSRAIGETMIVVMAAGLIANLTANPLEAVTTVTVQIVTLLVGDQEFDSAKTLAAFALGLTLFVATLLLNVVALAVVRKYREKYD